MIFNPKVKELPEVYRILPKIIDFVVPGFEKSCTQSKTLSIEYDDSIRWFYDFCENVQNAIGNKYFPLVRLCDGEYQFILGKNRASLFYPFWYRWLMNSRYLVKEIFRRKFLPHTENLYTSGNYSTLERKRIIKKYLTQLQFISEKGILAIHFIYGDKPFAEAAWPMLKKVFDNNKIVLSASNYVPFYFVYALLSGAESNRIFKDRRILVVNSSVGEKRAAIIDGILKRGATSVQWLEISSNRSIYDKINVTPFISRIDVVLVGAGIGKPNIFQQLEPLKTLCVDIGYYFEVLANEEAKFWRPLCCPDDELDYKKVKFISEEEKVKYKFY